MGTYKFSCNGSEYYLPVVNKDGGSLAETPLNLLYAGNKFLEYPALSEFDVSGITSGFPIYGESYGVLNGDSNGWTSTWACPPVVIYDIGGNVKLAPCVAFYYKDNDNAYGAIATFYVYNPKKSTTYWRTYNVCWSTYNKQDKTPEQALLRLNDLDKIIGFTMCVRVNETILSVSEVTKDTEVRFNTCYLLDSSNIKWIAGNAQDISPALTFTDETPSIDNDPFAPGGNSGTGGGGGNFDNTSAPIEIPNLPTISAASTGFISLYNPSLSQLNQLSEYLWSDLFDTNGWKKLFANPMDAILGLSILPVAIPSDGIREVKVGNIGTGISLTIAASQFVEVDCGSIDVNEHWGAYLDYEPYTQAQIFLPYIGVRPISVDEIMGKTVRVVYHVDILTGACCCFVKCGDSVLYTYNGQCSIPIPITGADYISVVNGVINIAGSVGSLVSTGGASAPTAISSIATSVVNQMKPQIEKSGSIYGSAGVLNMQTPYLILIRPRQALPAKQNEFIGYPSLITVQLTELTGYTEVQSIHLENIPATQEELAEIESLLEGGVIF